MAHDVELVEQNRGLRRMRLRRQAERFPHVHHGKAKARALPRAKPGVEGAHARLRAVLTAEPDRPPANEVADHDAVGVTFANRNLVDADHPRCWGARARQLGLHVLHLQRLDRVPIERQFFRHVLDRCLAAAPADIKSKALGVERIVRQKIQLLSFHLAAIAALDPPHLQLQIYPRVSARQIAHPPDLAVVPAHLNTTAAAARRFFERRLSVITRAFGSPKIPRTVGSGRKPRNEYVSQSRRLRFLARTIHYSCRIPGSAKMQNLLAIPNFPAFSTSKITHSIPRRPSIIITRPGRISRSTRIVLTSVQYTDPLRARLSRSPRSEDCIIATNAALPKLPS